MIYVITCDKIYVYIIFLAGKSWLPYLNLFENIVDAKKLFPAYSYHV